MIKTKNILKCILLSCLMLLSAIILFACTKQEIKFEYTTIGNGSVVLEKTTDNSKIYRAVPDEWNEFVGWYNGYQRISENQTLTVNKDLKVEARFASSAKSTADRHLNSFYNSYVEGEQKEGEYFNYSLTSNLDFVQGEKVIQRDVSLYGYIDFDSSSQFAFEVKDKSKTEFAFYYNNTLENGNIYIQINEEKYSYTDMGLLTNIFNKLQNPSSSAWNLDSLFKDENTNYLINQYFGVKNSMGFTKLVENVKNSSNVTLSYNKILNLLKNMADNTNSASVLQKFIHALTCEYKDSILPEMNLSFKTNYTTKENKEFIDNVEIVFDLQKDYVVNFDGTKYTLPKSDFTLKIENINYQMSDTANTISNEILSSFPQPTVNMINVHADGELDFLNVTAIEGGEDKKVVDKYIIEFDADLNPLALVSFKKDREGSYHDIEWEKLGFLSFRVSLVAETDPSALKEQQKRHNNVTDYINILIDTKNNGANAYVFIGLYTPNTLLSKSYLYNHSFNIPSLIKIVEDKNSENDGNSNVILSLLTSLVSGGIILENTQDFNSIINDLLIQFLSLLNFDAQLLEKNLTTTENGFSLALADVRSKIREFEADVIKQEIPLLSGWDIKLDKTMFGDDEEYGINYMSITMNNPTTNTVLKNTDNNYLNSKGEVIIDNFNSAHLVMIGVNQTSGISAINQALSIDDVIALKGNTITIAEGVMSDGSIVSKVTNNKGNSVSIEMKIEDVEILSSNSNQYRVRVLLKFKDYPNVFSSLPLLGDEIYNVIGVPYGLITYQTTLQF